MTGSLKPVLAIILVAGLAGGTCPALGQDNDQPAGVIRLREFESAPFPYRGIIPGKGVPFLDVEAGSRRGHTSARGGVYWEDETYSDNRTLLFIPAGFDPGAPAVMVVFLHGNQATLSRDVQRRQRVTDQLAASGLNAVLVAPQLAVNALDSSAGKFWEPDGFASFLEEAAAELHEVAPAGTPPGLFAAMPVVVVAYSGGYLPAAFALANPTLTRRIAGVVLFDALYGEIGRFEAWIEDKNRNGFFFNASSNSSRAGAAELKGQIEDGVDFEFRMPERLTPGTVAFVNAGNVAHDDFVTRAWVDDPLREVLAKVALPDAEPVAVALAEPTPAAAVAEPDPAPAAESPEIAAVGVPSPEPEPDDGGELDAAPPAPLDPADEPDPVRPTAGKIPDRLGGQVAAVVPDQEPAQPQAARTERLAADTRRAGEELRPDRPAPEPPARQDNWQLVSVVGVVGLVLSLGAAVFIFGMRLSRPR